MDSSKEKRVEVVADVVFISNTKLNFTPRLQNEPSYDTGAEVLKDVHPSTIVTAIACQHSKEGSMTNSV